MTHQICIELQGLSDAFPNDFDWRCKFNFDVDVASGSDANDVSSDAVVCAAMVLVHQGELKDIAFVNGPNLEKNIM